MLIGIDAHNLEGQRTGVGRYLLNLLQEWAALCHCEAVGRSNPVDGGSIITGSPRPARAGLAMTESVKFILYFKDQIPPDLQPTPTISPSLREARAKLSFGESQRGWFNFDLFETRVLKTRSTAKFTHWDLPRLAAKDKVDILFCPAYVSPIIYGGKIALTLHDISYETRPQEFNWPSLADKILLKWVSRQSAKKAGVIFTPSEFSRQEVIKYYGVPAERVFVTPLGVDSSLSDSPFDGAINVVNNKKFDSPAYGTNTIEAVKKKYGLSGKFIFYVGSIFTRRHLPEIISAFERLTKESNYQLLLGGEDYTDGKSVDELVKKINEKLGREAVLRVDFIDDNELKLLYSACAFFIWLSDYEGFGLPMLEAMSLGAPVITTNGSSLSEVAGEAALLIRDNADVEEIYRAMHKLARDSALREELIARGKEQAAKFSWQKCARKTLEVLTEE